MILRGIRSASGIAIVVASAFAGLLFTAGCGGGGGGGGGNQNDSVIRTETNGRLQAVRIGPAPGAVFVSRSSTFQIEWPSNDPPPAEFTVELNRYQEPRGAAPRVITPQPVTVTRQGGSYLWNIRRRDNFELDGGGVYFLRLQSPGGQQVLATFIASNDRSEAATRGETERPGTGGSLGGLNILPASGSTFIPKGTTFQLVWSGQAPPPSEFTAQLRRYKEARGSESSSDSEQAITVDRVDNGLIWNLRRRDNFNLEENGVYYLDITAPGEAPYRAAYIISSDL